MHLRADERVLDMGCGRGAVLVAVARRLTSGRVTGIDLWSTHDQSGNARDVTMRNAALEGVQDRVEIETGDMRALPFPDHTFDLVVSSLAIHNISSNGERAKAVAEAWRACRGTVGDCGYPRDLRYAAARGQRGRREPPRARVALLQTIRSRATLSSRRPARSERSADEITFSQGRRLRDRRADHVLSNDGRHTCPRRRPVSLLSAACTADARATPRHQLPASSSDAMVLRLGW